MRPSSEATSNRAFEWTGFSADYGHRGLRNGLSIRAHHTNPPISDFPPLRCSDPPILRASDPPLCFRTLLPLLPSVKLADPGLMHSLFPSCGQRNLMRESLE